MKRHVYIFFSWKVIVQKVYLGWYSIGVSYLGKESGELGRHRVSISYTPIYSSHLTTLIKRIVRALHVQLNAPRRQQRRYFEPHDEPQVLGLSVSCPLRQLHTLYASCLRRSEAHIHHALRRWINGLTTCMGELLTAAQAQLE
jgi:hypothetical protein